MTPERRKCAVRKAPQRRPVLDNRSLGAFQQERIDLWKPKRCYEINTRFYGDVDSWRPTWDGTRFLSTEKQQTFSVVTGDYIRGRAEKNALILLSSFALSNL
jgi:hypothetical protein